MYSDKEIDAMTLQICHGRSCPRCPIDGFCFDDVWKTSESLRNEIIDAHKRIFPRYHDPININESDLLTLFSE